MMQQNRTWMEIYRFGYVNIPGVLFNYAKELELELEDIGVLSTLLYTFQKSKPFLQSGVTIEQILQYCPFLTKQKLSRRLNRLKRLSIIEINAVKNDKEVYLEPLFIKLEFFITRDNGETSKSKTDKTEIEKLVKEFRSKIEQLQLELEEEKNKRIIQDNNPYLLDANYKKVADFISRKTGNLMSAKMAKELKVWLSDMAFTPEFLLCMLELSFERNIFNPHDISRIAADLKQYAIKTVEGLDLYFKQYVDSDKNRAWKFKRFDPDIAEFGDFTGIDMNAEARKKAYYKWRFDWNFSHKMIMKAGELMCRHTKNGGLEYIDSVLHDWMSKEIHQVEEVEKEISNFKMRNKKQKSNNGVQKQLAGKSSDEEYEIFVVPNKSK